MNDFKTQDSLSPAPQPERVRESNTHPYAQDRHHCVDSAAKAGYPQTDPARTVCHGVYSGL